MPAPAPDPASPLRGLPLWPEDSAIDLFHRQPTMGAIRFSDAAVYVEPLRSEIEARALDRDLTEPIAGGAFRLQAPERWSSPYVNLIAARAQKLVDSMLGTSRGQLQAAAAIVVPRSRALPLRAAPAARASVVALLGGGGLYLQHERISGARAEAPAGAGGLMIAHPSSMRPCVRENPAERPVVLMTWDYAL